MAQFVVAAAINLTRDFDRRPTALPKIVNEGSSHP
jgi:hypothetical protein